MNTTSDSRSPLAIVIEARSLFFRSQGYAPGYIHFSRAFDLRYLEWLREIANRPDGITTSVESEILKMGTLHGSKFFGSIICVTDNAFEPCASNVPA